MRRFLWRPVCHWCSLDGWIDWDVCTVTVILSSGCRSFVLPIVRLLVKGAFRWNQLQSAQRLLRLRLSCYGDKVGAGPVQRRSCVSSVVGHWPAVSTKHPGTPERLANIFVQQLMLAYNNKKIHKLSRICFADVNPEVNVQIMDSKWLLKPTWG